MRGRTDTDVTTPRNRRHDFWGVVLDASDGPALGRFYSALLGWELKTEPGWATIAPLEGVAYLGFQTSREYVHPKWPTQVDEQQQMMHLDFEVDDLAVASEHAIELGAVLAPHQPNPNNLIHFDPEGHPFCVYTGS